MDIRGKKVLVFGSGISGEGSCRLLLEKGAEVVLYDGNEKLCADEIEAKILETKKENGQFSIVLGTFPEEIIEELSFVVMSPGVPTDLPIVEKMREKSIPIWGEIELAYVFGKGDVLAITGTNGKTTTTALLGQIMQDYKEHAYIVGNIGTPYTSVAQETTDDAVIVAEISSFQLETIHTFHPKVSAILNITPDHLNRHHTMEAYIEAKERIAENQTKADVCVLNYEDDELQKFGEKTAAQVLYFSSARKLEKGIYLDGTKIICAADVPVEVIRKNLLTFPGVEHRIEFVAEKRGVLYYNDSKGTNPDAAIKGIQAMNRPTILIGGGYDKDSEYDEWIKAFDGKVRKLVLLGATREKIAQSAHANGFDDIIMADTFEEAFEQCVKYAKPGDAVLLSPACASWGMFKNYEERGDKFKELVDQL